MSYTTIKAVWPGDRYEDIEELRNSWGSAPVVWEAMARTYLGTRFWHSNEVSGTDGKLWNLWKRESIPAQHRAVLALTFDNVLVTKEHYARAAADIRAFLADFQQSPEKVNHWPRIAELFESNPDYPALAFHWTSVTEDPLRGPWNEEAEEYGPTDWTKPWDMYKELDGIGSTAGTPDTEGASK
jgi:hypothetical protein